ncbi:MAG: hypothetical protein PWP31_693 [Clostridia bacterium]|nr:hypothetical protein [Clostridia bacterium]
MKLKGPTLGRIQGKFAYLKAKGIRCKLETINPKGITQYRLPELATTIRLIVHKKDIARAQQLLSEL